MIPARLKDLTEHTRYWIANSDHEWAKWLREACAREINSGTEDHVIEAAIEQAAPLIAAEPIESLYQSRHLFPMCFPMPKKIGDLFSEGASKAGYHAVSTYYTCPEKSRLQRIGVKPRFGREFIESVEMNNLSLGSVIHGLLALRVIFGQNKIMQLLDNDGVIGVAIHEADRIKLMNIMLVYDETWPLDRESFEYIGIEATVITDIKTIDGKPCYRSARYDKVVRFEGGVYSLEHKSSARGGVHAMLDYTPQFWTQVALWNANPRLVETWGPMRGVIPDVIIKTEIPRCERPGVRSCTPRYESMILEYLRGADAMRVPSYPDGHAHRFLHACYGNKYGGCEYIDLCHDDARRGYVGLPEDS